MNNLKKIPFSIFFLIILIVIAVKIVPDFGISFDEPIERQSRLINAKYIVSSLGFEKIFPYYTNDKTVFENYPDRYYGVAAQLPLVILDLLNVSHETKMYWLVSHFYTHLLFLLSVVCFYLLLKKLKFSKILIFLTSLLYIFNPRIYAHSFYNVKDLVFLSLFMISTFLIYCYLDNQQIKFLILASITSAFAVNSRMMGLLLFAFIFLTILFNLKHNQKKLLSHSLIALLSFFGCLYLIYPVLWKNFFSEIITSFLVFSKYEVWNGQIIFNGQVIRGNNLPILYVPTWIAITTPLIQLFYWILALLLTPLLIIKDHLKKEKKLLVFFCFIAIIASYFAIIFFNSTLYGDWRHLYYLHVPFSILTAFLLDYLLKKNKILWKCSIFLIVISMFFTLSWMIRNHPHYYVYFNRLAGSNWDEKWDRDIWRLSTKQALEKLLAMDTDEKILIEKQYNAEINSWILDENEQNRIVFVDSRDEANYYLVDYRNIVGNYQANNNDFLEYLVIEVENKPIMAVYKRQTN